MSKIYYVYILICSDSTYYTGITSALVQRLGEHNSGLYPKSYTHGRRPVKLVFYEGFTNPEVAIMFEKKIKGWNRIKKLALIQGSWSRLKILAECKNATTHRNFAK